MIRALILAIVFGAAAMPLAADEAVAPLLFIERIEVRNAQRVSPEVVIAESRLREGREYSEVDLRDAATRLGRLPFLLSVDFALEKGSERGRHVLVLTIQETKPFFFLLDLQPYHEQEVFLDVDYSNNRGSTGESVILGGRWFVGRRGAFHIGFSTFGRDREFSREYASVAVGYTQYDIFGSRAFATINLKKPLEGYGEGLLSPQLVVGVPVSANQTVTLEYDETRFASEDVTIFDTVYPERFGQRLVSARWSYDTTNEPFFPTRGTLLQVTPMIGWTDGARVFYVDFGQQVEYGAHHSQFYGAEAAATQYYELTDRDSIWANVRGELARENYEDDVALTTTTNRTANSTSVGIGYSHSFWTRDQRAGGGDSRIEVTARFSNRTRAEEELTFFRTENDVRQVGIAWLRRTSWGTLRLGGGYAW